MFKQLLSGIALVSVVFLAAPPTDAAGPHEPHAYQQRSVQPRRQPQIKRHGQTQHPARERHQPHHVRRHHRSARQHPDHRYHQRHQPHHGVFVGIHIGNRFAQPSYAHGHHLHVHDAYCPVIIRSHVHRHVYSSPTWEVTYYPHENPLAQARLHIIVTPYQGEVYIDGHFIGAAEAFDNGEKLVPLSPGRHTVRLRHHNRDYTQQIRVKSGNTAIVKAHYARRQ